MPNDPRALNVRHRAAVNAMAAESLVADVARRLEPLGVQVIPVKGALLQQLVYTDPAQRSLTDVDLLVRGADLPRSIAALQQVRGYRSVGRRWAIAMGMQTPFGIGLDLHGALFDRFRYRFFVDEIFARATPDDQLFGARVLLPDMRDVYAHLIGKFASDQRTHRAERQLEDIARVGAHHSMPDARATAAHLVRVGMRRAARYALGFAEDPFAQAVLTQLPPDRVGETLVRAAREAVLHSSPDSTRASIAAHLLNDSLPRSVWSGVRGAIRSRLP